jgi:NAD+ synthase (glutamine-hydrolysing)
MIAENGAMLSESRSFEFESNMISSDIDTERLAGERTRHTSFSQDQPEREYREIFFPALALPSDKLRRNIEQYPFVPSDQSARTDSCREIFAIQTSALAKRLRHIGAKSLVLGISGGLDSTLALLAAVRTFDKLKLDRKGIFAITMPGFGTTDRTKSNAVRLSELLGTTLLNIPISDAVTKHFEDISHDPNIHDTVYENSQARERTQILMDYANKVGGIVLGTGDLSEMALGWSTYNGDHISMYGINSGIPKTLVRYIVEWCAEELFAGESSEVLHDIISTPVSPELLPPSAYGAILQETESIVGPYALHDFFLYYFVRHGFAPKKIQFLATAAFDGVYGKATITKWLEVFLRRFFTQQFKRNCLPDGVKVGSVALSPRGDWRMPSDAEFSLWAEELKD